MGRVSAEPTRLDAFATGSGERCDAVTRASGTLQDALDALHAALPRGHGLGARTVPRGPIDRVRALDGGLAEVARRFRAADAGPGVVTVDEGALGQPLPIAYTPEQRQRLVDEAAEEYANLAEDDGDPTTRAELAGYLALIRGEIDAAGEGLPPAEAFEARKRRAAELLEAAGPRDLSAALELIGDDIGDGGPNQERGEGSLEDLATYLSLGLEDDPARAQDWIDTLEEEWDWDGYHGEDTERGELLALLATQVDTDTRAFGEVIFWRIFDDPWNPDGNDLLDAVAGDTSPFTVLFDGLADSPRLANAIVDRGIGLAAAGDDVRAATWDALLDARYDGFENGGDGRGDDSEDDRYQDALGALLTAATNERLLPEERVSTALGLLEYLEDHAGNDDRYVRFSGPVREALGRTIDPLLDAWIAGTEDELAVPGDPPIALPRESLDLLQRALERIAHDPDAARGLTLSITDFTQEQIHGSVRDGGAADLSELAIVLHNVIGGTSGSRYDALRDTVEGGGAVSALESLFTSALGAAPVAGPAASAVYDALKAYHGNPTGGGDEILPPHFRSFVRTELLLAHIEAGDVTMTPQMREDLEQAAADGGVTAVEDLLLNDPAFAEIEAVIEDEKQRIDPELDEALDGIFAG